MEPTTEPESTPENTQPQSRLARRYGLFQADLPFPIGPEQRAFEIRLQAPAKLLRACAVLKQASRLHGAPAEWKLRLCFQCSPDGEFIVDRFTLQRLNEIVAVPPEEELASKVIDVVVSPLDGDVVAIWRGPRGQKIDELAPITELQPPPEPAPQPKIITD